VVDRRPPTQNLHLCFYAREKEQVDAFHEAGVKARFRSNGSPGYRDYAPGYYAAYLLDPDGNNVEALLPRHRKPQLTGRLARPNSSRLRFVSCTRRPDESGEDCNEQQVAREHYGGNGAVEVVRIRQVPERELDLREHERGRKQR
jgi:hypothetical protein